MFLRPRMTRTGGHAGPYVWGGVTGVTNSDNPWLTAVQENTATRLVVSGGSYDAEQRFLVNENPLSVRTALGVGLGTAGCAGPIFAPDKYGSVMWIDQATAFSGAVAPVPALTIANTWTVITKHVPSRLTANRRLWISGASGIPRAYYDSAGKINYYENTTGEIKSASTVASLLGVSDIGAQPVWTAYVAAGTSLTILVSLDGSSWTAAVSGATITATALGGANLYVGSNAAGGSYGVGKFYSLTVRDGDESAVKVAEFTPGMFVGGNRADGDTAVDAYGVTWTVERPAATTDMPRVMVGRSEQYISLPGVSGEYVSTPDTAANSITGDLAVKAFLVTPSAGTDRVVGSKWTGSGNQRSWYAGINAANAPYLSWTTDGTAGTQKTYTSTVAVTSDIKYVAYWLDTNDGASGHKVVFYTSADGAAWSVLDTVSGASTTSVFDSTAGIVVGAINAGTAVLAAFDVGWAEVISGDLDGTLVERIDAAEASPNSTTWTSSTSGATVTVNKSASAQYHATVVPANTTIVQGDGVNDFAQVCGDDTITDFVPATGLTLVLDASFSSGAGSGGVFASSANATTDDGLIVSRNSTNPRVQGRLDDGTTIATIGDNANNVTYSDRFQATFAFGSSDHEAFVDGVSVEAATNAVTAETAAGALRFGAEINGSNPAAYDLYGVAVLGERTSDTEAAAYATEGLTR